MLAKLQVKSNNQGAAFLRDFDEQVVHLESILGNDSLRKSTNCCLFNDNFKARIQILEVSFAKNSIFINCFIINENTGGGGKAIFELILV